jgi:hypothetical protein
MWLLFVVKKKTGYWYIWIICESPSFYLFVCVIHVCESPLSDESSLRVHAPRWWPDSFPQNRKESNMRDLTNYIQKVFLPESFQHISTSNQTFTLWIVHSMTFANDCAKKHKSSGNSSFEEKTNRYKKQHWVSYTNELTNKTWAKQVTFLTHNYKYGWFIARLWC